MVAVLARFREDKVFDDREVRSAISQALVTEGLRNCSETTAIMSMLAQIRRGEKPTYEFPNKPAEYAKKTYGL